MTATDVDDIAVNRRAEIERWLDERRVEWEYLDALPLDQVDRIASLANQARLEPLNEEVVDRYAADMERGDVFPPVLARRQGKRLILLGGNHRAAAAGRANVSTLAAYVVTVEPEMAVRLTYEDNRRHGLPPSEAERLHQAVHLCNNGYSQPQAAELAGVSVKKLQQAVARYRSDQRAARLGIRNFDRLAASARTRLDGVRSDPVFDAVARLCVDANLGASDCGLLVTKINNTRSEADALAVVDAEAKRRRETMEASAGGMVRKQTPRTRLLTALTTIGALDAVEIAASCATPDQRTELARQTARAADALAAIAKELRR